MLEDVDDATMLTCSKSLLSTWEPGSYQTPNGGEDDDGGPAPTDGGDEGDGGESLITHITNQRDTSEHGADGEGEDSEPPDDRTNTKLGNEAPGRELEEGGGDDCKV